MGIAFADNLTRLVFEPAAVRGVMVSLDLRALGPRVPHFGGSREQVAAGLAQPRNLFTASPAAVVQR
jgi:hypothetical protein